MNTLKFNQIKFNHIGEQPSMPLQEKSVTITKNGTTEVVPDKGYALKRVNITTDIKGSGIDPNDPESEYFTEYLDGSFILSPENQYFMYGTHEIKYIDPTDGHINIFPIVMALYANAIGNVKQISFMINKKIYMDGAEITVKDFIIANGLLETYNSIPRITKEEFYNLNI